MNIITTVHRINQVNQWTESFKPMILITSFSRLIHQQVNSFENASLAKLLFFFINNIFDIHRHCKYPAEHHEQWQHRSNWIHKFIFNPTRIRHLLSLNTVWQSSAGMRLKNSAFESILKINERIRMIFRWNRCCCTWCVGEVSNQKTNKKRKYWFGFSIEPVFCSKCIVNIIQSHSNFKFDMFR